MSQRLMLQSDQKRPPNRELVHSTATSTHPHSLPRSFYSNNSPSVVGLRSLVKSRDCGASWTKRRIAQNVQGRGSWRSIHLTSRKNDNHLCSQLRQSLEIWVLTLPHVRTWNDTIKTHSGSSNNDNDFLLFPIFSLHSGRTTAYQRPTPTYKQTTTSLA